MTAYFVTRHPGAIEWAQRRGITARRIKHLNPRRIGAGDLVLGNLPVHVVAEIIARGARYLHLVLDVPRSERGGEWTADEMESRLGARLVEYRVTQVVGKRDKRAASV